MTRTIVKKFVAVLIAVFVVLGVVVQPVFGISLREAGDNGTLRMYNRNAGYHFGNNVPEPFAGGVSLDNGAKWAELRIVTNGQAYSAYCLQFGVGAHTGDSMVAQDYYDLPETTRRLINYMLMFGYDFSHEGDNVSKYFATQALIWQIEYGTVNTEYEQILNDDFFDSIPEAQAYYNEIKEKVYTYQVVPSFCGRTPSTTPVHEMTYNSEKRTYEAILTDTNGGAI